MGSHKCACPSKNFIGTLLLRAVVCLLGNNLFILIHVRKATSTMAVANVTIKKTEYANMVLPGKENATIYKYTMSNGFISVELITYGSTITSIKYPDISGVVADVVLGFDDINGYLGSLNPYAGATVGRVANRISNGSFELDGVTYQISKNIGKNTLHGGVEGFNKKIWDSYVDDCSVVMTYHSGHLEEGFPGNLLVETRYTLTENNELVINYKAKTDKPTPVNIVNHSYFNLAGVDKASTGLYEHDVKINGDAYTPLSEQLLPTGEIKSVTNTPFDLRNISNLGQKIKETPENEGYDINYVVNGKGFREVSQLHHPPTGRYMEVYSDQLGVQFYTGNSLKNIPGRDGVIYNKHSALCFETQGFPDAVNHKDTFPSVILRPGELYQHTVCFKFSVKQYQPTIL